jgi:Flp pilus assembly protein TadD
LAKARILYAEGRFAESRTWCERSIAGSPHKRASHLLLAQLCRRLSDLKGQVRETEILSSIPDGPTGWNDPDVEAIVALRRDPGLQLEALDQMAAEGRAEESMAILASMAKGADPSGYATGRLVRALVAQNRLREAESVLREKVTGYPAGERFAFHLGIVLALQKKFDEAADEFRRVTELKPDHVDAHFNLGLALVDANRDQEAGQAFAQTVRLSPGHIEARVHLAELLIDAGRAAEARPHLQVAARLAPRDAKVSELLARLPKAP